MPSRISPAFERIRAEQHATFVDLTSRPGDQQDLSRAVNAPAIGGAEMRKLRPMMELAERLGKLASVLVDGPVQRAEVRYSDPNTRGQNREASRFVTRQSVSIVE